MKKLVYMLASVALIATTTTSCDKTETPDPVPPIDTNNVVPPAPTPFTPVVGDVNGAMAAIKMNLKMEQQGFPIDIAYDVAVATFYSASTGSNLVDAGAVSVNTNALEKMTNNSYTKMATMGMTPSSLGLDNGAEWSVAGGNGIPAISYNHGTDFPEYSGTFPTSVTKANGFTLDFNSSTVSSADSVYVFIAAGSVSFMKAYGPKAGSITISASDLSKLPAVSDKTAILEILPVKFATRQFGTKYFAFIKEEANVRYININ